MKRDGACVSEVNGAVHKGGWQDKAANLPYCYIKLNQSYATKFVSCCKRNTIY